MTPAIRRRLLQIGFVVLFQALLLFVAAGTLKWFSAWVYLLLYVLYIAMNGLILFPRKESREMIEERSQIKEGSKAWDKRIGAVTAVLGPAILLVAGLDFRLGWAGGINPWSQAAAYCILALSYALFGWAMVSNRFFSMVVRIQKERGHSVETGGPYAVVRHPGYASLLLSYLSIPPALGSLWAYLPAAGLVVTLVVRTALEDRTLQDELQGYKDYSGRVQYRLIPGVW
jgi:protein-S-isoprenylcysteine O-methyltransferase Ste14